MSRAVRSGLHALFYQVQQATGLAVAVTLTLQMGTLRLESLKNSPRSQSGGPLSDPKPSSPDCSQCLWSFLHSETGPSSMLEGPTMVPGTRGSVEA